MKIKTIAPSWNDSENNSLLTQVSFRRLAGVMLPVSHRWVAMTRGPMHSYKIDTIGVVSVITLQSCGEFEQLCRV